jgi:hypothetical protein
MAKTMKEIIMMDTGKHDYQAAADNFKPEFGKWVKVGNMLPFDGVESNNLYQYLIAEALKEYLANDEELRHSQAAWHYTCGHGLKNGTYLSMGIEIIIDKNVGDRLSYRFSIHKTQKLMEKALERYEKELRRN